MRLFPRIRRAKPAGKLLSSWKFSLGLGAVYALDQAQDSFGYWFSSGGNKKRRDESQSDEPQDTPNLMWVAETTGFPLPNPLDQFGRDIEYRVMLPSGVPQSTGIRLSDVSFDAVGPMLGLTPEAINYLLAEDLVSLLADRGQWVWNIADYQVYTLGYERDLQESIELAEETVSDRAFADFEAIRFWTVVGLLFAGAYDAWSDDSKTQERIPPVALDDLVESEENEVLAGQVPAATDADGSVVRYELVDNVGEGQGGLTFNADGSYVFDPGTDFDELAEGETREITFTYRAIDNDGQASEIKTITLKVSGVNDVPVAGTDRGLSEFLFENQVLERSVPEGTDVDGTIVRYELVDDVGEGQGVLTFNSDGSYEFNPSGDFDALPEGETREVTFTYKAVDDQGGESVAATITLTVIGVNNAPVAFDLEVSTGENEVLSGQVPAATDADGTVAEYELVETVPEGQGVLTFNADGSYVFDPGTDFDELAEGESREVSFTYRAIDNDGQASEVKTVTVTVSGVNDRPVATSDTAELFETQVFDGAVPEAADVDGTILRYVLAEDLADGDGTLIFTQDGSYRFDPGADFDALPEGETREVTFTYKAVDDQGGESDAETITLTVIGVNNAPVAFDLEASTGENEVLSGQVPEASDADGTVAEYELVETVLEGQGALTFNADGSYVFDPGTDFDELADGEAREITFTYRALDNDGQVSDVKTVRITVEGADDPAVLDFSQVGSVESHRVSFLEGGDPIELTPPGQNVQDADTSVFDSLRIRLDLNTFTDLPAETLALANAISDTSLPVDLLTLSEPFSFSMGGVEFEAVSDQSDPSGTVEIVISKSDSSSGLSLSDVEAILDGLVYSNNAELPDESTLRTLEVDLVNGGASVSNSAQVEIEVVRSSDVLMDAVSGPFVANEQLQIEAFDLEGALLFSVQFDTLGEPDVISGRLDSSSVWLDRKTLVSERNFDIDGESVSLMVFDQLHLRLPEFSGRAFFQVVEGAQYVDEATASIVDLDQSLRGSVVIPEGDTASLSLTPLTEAAVQAIEQAVNQPLPLGESMSAAEGQVLDQWYDKAAGLITELVGVDIKTTRAVAVNDDERFGAIDSEGVVEVESNQYGLKLAALSELSVNDADKVQASVDRLLADLALVATTDPETLEDQFESTNPVEFAKVQVAVTEAFETYLEVNDVVIQDSDGNVVARDTRAPAPPQIDGFERLGSETLVTGSAVLADALNGTETLEYLEFRLLFGVTEILAISSEGDGVFESSDESLSVVFDPVTQTASWEYRFVTPRDIEEIEFWAVITDAAEHASADRLFIPSNLSPIPENDVLNLVENEGRFVLAEDGVLVNDVDADGDAITVTGIRGASEADFFEPGLLLEGLQGEFGTLFIAADGSYTYFTDARSDVLQEGAPGVDRFVYQVSDGYGGLAEAALEIRIDGINDAPAVDAAGDGETQGHRAKFVHGGRATRITDAQATVTDIDSSQFAWVATEFSAAQFQDGIFESLFIGGPEGHELNDLSSVDDDEFVVVVDGVSFHVAVTASESGVVRVEARADSEGMLSLSDVESFLRSLHYLHAGVIGSEEGAREFRLSVADEYAESEVDVVTLDCVDSGDEFIGGTDGEDILDGTAGDDVLIGGSGDDQLFGGHDDDVLLGGDGADQLHGMNGDDFVFGEAGDDRYVTFHDRVIQSQQNLFVGGDGLDVAIFTGSVSEYRFSAVTEAEIDHLNALIAEAAVFRQVPGGLPGFEVGMPVLRVERLLDEPFTSVEYIQAEQMEFSDAVLAYGVAPDALDPLVSEVPILSVVSNEGGLDLISERQAPQEILGLQISGSMFGDQIRGGGGDDVLVGLGGNDVLRSDSGSDVLDGGEGQDLLQVSGALESGRVVLLHGGADADVFQVGPLSGALSTDDVVGMRIMIDSVEQGVDAIDLSPLLDAIGGDRDAAFTDIFEAVFVDEVSSQYSVDLTPWVASGSGETSWVSLEWQFSEPVANWDRAHFDELFLSDLLDVSGATVS